MTRSARPLLGAVRDTLNTDSKLDARWLVGLAAGLDQPVMGHQNITLTPDQEVRLERLSRPAAHVLTQSACPGRCCIKQRSDVI